MKKKPDWLKTAENAVKSKIENASSFLNGAQETVGKKTKEIDAEFSISDTSKSAAGEVKSFISNLSTKFQIKPKLRRACEKTGEAVEGLKQTAAFTKAEKKADHAKTFIQSELFEPVDDYLEKSGIKESANKISDVSISAYGKTRAFVKPYFAPETPEELLISTKNELLYINACILQVSRDEAQILANRLGAAITSKIAGVATVTGLLGLVCAFETAGTGTAIATLSGAAANSATLAWVGGLLGGGMAAGAVMTGGVGLAISVGVYKLLGSEARGFEDLCEVERRIVEATGFLVGAINEILDDSQKSLGMEEAELLLKNTLRPLHQLLQENAETIADNLDIKNNVAFKQHALADFEKQVIDGFEFFINEQTASRRKRYPEFAISGVFYALLSKTAVDDSRESQLALEAIRRVRKDWDEVSESELSSALAQYDPEQIRGLANNAKGIYHEMLFVENYNNAHDDSYAEMHVATNHPGSDVVIRSTESDVMLAQYQLKASSSDQIIKEHFEKYPAIDVLATEEIALKSHRSVSSGISNEEITGNMEDAISDIADNTVGDRVGESAGLAGLAAAGLEAIEVLRGRKRAPAAGIDALKTTGVAATSTALVAYLFG